MAVGMMDPRTNISGSGHLFDDLQPRSVDPQFGSVRAHKAEYETEIHFQKCYGVMAELVEAHNNLDSFVPESGFRFLDLGCAPGGFSSYLLEDPRCINGFGVTLPSASGGFPMRLRNPKFFLQQADLFEIGPMDVISSEVHVCICDAQYLRNNVAWDERYRGVRCRSKQHGVWALLMKQFWLGLTRLATGGMLIFRFGWRDAEPDDLATIWYKRCTLRLFSLLHDLFTHVKEVKSDYFNALQSSFYVCCAGFKAERFKERQVAKLLGGNFNYLITTRIDDANELEVLPQVDKIRTPEVDKKITDMLDRIEKIRLVHEQCRARHQKEEDLRDDPSAVVFLSPAPDGMSDEQISAAFSVYGRVRRVDRDGDYKVYVQLGRKEQAQSAVVGFRQSRAFGPHVRMWLQNEAQQQDLWGNEWANGADAGMVAAPVHPGGKGGKGKAPRGYVDGGKGASKGKGQPWAAA